MNNLDRGETFALYLGNELKGEITKRGFTAKRVAELLGHSPAAFTNWLNGKTQIPLSTFTNASELIGADPAKLAGYAYDRLCEDMGEPKKYVPPVRNNNVTDILGGVDPETLPHAAYQGNEELPDWEST